MKDLEILQALLQGNHLSKVEKLRATILINLLLIELKSRQPKKELINHGR